MDVFTLAVSAASPLTAVDEGAIEAEQRNRLTLYVKYTVIAVIGCAVDVWIRYGGCGRVCWCREYRAVLRWEEEQH